MRRLILLALMAAMVLPANAVKRMTVDQLKQGLAADYAARRTDDEISRQFGDLELSERLTARTLDRIAAELPLEPKSALALQLLADRSAFLDPPVSELPAAAIPDAATQQHMMDAARGYVVQTVPHLIDFFVTHNTNRFDESGQVLVKGEWPVRAGLHLVGRSSQEVTFRDGKESRQTTPAANSTSSGANRAQQESGLSSWGEFGPALAVVLTDAAKGKVTFSHWERTPTALAAVFHYSVPRSASHYAVSYCCVPDDPLVPRKVAASSGRITVRDLADNSASSVGSHAYSQTPGYHGSLSVDPATGAILRVTIEAEMKGDSPLMRAATVIEYGPIQLGERSFICPVRALAFSMEELKRRALPGTGVGNWGNSNPNPTGEAGLLLNETLFTDYHRLATTARIVPSDVPAELQHRESQPPGHGASTDLPPISVAPDSQPPAVQASANASPTLPVSATPAPVAPAAAVVPEISMSTANGVPDDLPGTHLPQDASVTLKLISRLVDVGIVAYDKKGRPVEDLKRDDFEVYDNGHKQEIRFFSQVAGDDATPVPSNQADNVFSNRTDSNQTGDAAAGGLAAPVPAAGATILLIDESHIGWSDLSNARMQMLKFLGALAPGERVGLYTMSGLGFRVLTEITTDHAALIARLQKWMPSAQSVASAQQEEARNRQQIEEVRNKEDLSSVNGKRNDGPTSGMADPQLRDFGSNPARASLIILRGVARHLAAVSGHKNLVWVSSDNVFADWRDQAADTERGGKHIDSFALHAQEAMNDAHAAVYPFDVSQLESGAIDADIQHRNVELNPTNMLSGTAGTTTPEAGRSIAQMHQDIHPIQGPIVQVAEATGGRTIRRAGDLTAALSKIVEDGRSTYQLSFAPQGPADDQYHAITLKVTGKRGLALRYRTGYLYAKEPATLKDRFRQAIWRPAEMNEVAVTANVDALTPGANVKINIATGDLGLLQQDGRWTDKLDVFFIQRDDAGLHAQVEGQTLGLRLISSTYQNLLSGGLAFDHFVQLKPGMASLRVLVVDENSGRMGSVTIPAAALGGGN